MSTPLSSLKCKPPPPTPHSSWLSTFVLVPLGNHLQAHSVAFVCGGPISSGHGVGSR